MAASFTSKLITVQGISITAVEKDKADFICLSDIARYKDNLRTNYIIQNWMRNRSTIEFLGLWERINNENFKGIEFDAFKSNSGSNSFSLTPKLWIAATRAIGMYVKSGRYGGGVFARSDIAFEFASWISAEFKLYLIKEFQRLKEEENERLALGWDVRRQLTKINYRIHTDAIKEDLIPRMLTNQQTTSIYASEADVLNMALFGLTAKEWRKQHPNDDGNLRDYADVTQLVVLANLESLNAELIRQEIAQSERLLTLNQTAITQMKSLTTNPSLKKLE